METEGTYPNQIHFYIKDRGKTAKEVAAELGVSERMLNHYQHGRVAMPVGYRERLASILSASVEEIFPKNVSPAQRPVALTQPSLVLPTPPSIIIPQPSLASNEDVFVNVDPLLFSSLPESSEEESITYSIWFGQRTKDIEALVRNFSRREEGHLAHYQHLQRRITSDIERWNYTTMQHDSLSHDYRISRRTALTTLATLSTVLLMKVQQQPTAAVMEEFLAQCSASVTTCRLLMDGDGISAVSYTVPKYLPLLERFAQQPSQYQRVAAYLAAQSCLLMATAELHRLRYQQSNTYYRLAVQYGKLSDDPNLHVAAIKQYAMRQLEDRHSEQALALYQQALPVIQQAYQEHGAQALLPRVEGQIYLGIATSLAFVHKQRNKEIDAYYDRAQETFADPTVQQLPYMNLGTHLLYLNEGLGRAEMGDITGGRASLAKVQTQNQQSGISERLRFEIMNQQAAIALKDGDLEEFVHYSILGMQGAQTIGSERRRQEVLDNWKLALKMWPDEPRVRELAEVLV